VRSFKPVRFTGLILSKGKESNKPDRFRVSDVDDIDSIGTVDERSLAEIPLKI